MTEMEKILKKLDAQSVLMKVTKKLWGIPAKKLLGSGLAPFLHFSFHGKTCCVSPVNSDSACCILTCYIDLSFTALTANTFFLTQLQVFSDSYFVVGFAGFCPVMVFCYWPESTTQRNWDQSDRYFFWGGRGGVCLLYSCSGFLCILCGDNILLLTTIYQMEDPR